MARLDNGITDRYGLNQSFVSLHRSVRHHHHATGQGKTVRAPKGPERSGTKVPDDTSAQVLRSRDQNLSWIPTPSMDD